ncbi:hypothetical protein Taro_041250 [Colocasia esculenta]|uniref:Uncharacterized protein n=1 Tax=Colocasia esculenta TaxID=4460 RepID=A0A843WL40_COLES|nr:hypothetical protein [Colocasia esculenta]
MVQPTRRPCGNPWSEEIYEGLREKVTSLPIRNDRPEGQVATSREQNATLRCEERDGAVRSGSKVATERFVAFRTQWGMLSRQDHRTRPIGLSRSQGLHLNLAEKGHVLGLRSRTALY